MHKIITCQFNLGGSRDMQRLPTKRLKWYRSNLVYRLMAPGIQLQWGILYLNSQVPPQEYRTKGKLEQETGDRLNSNTCDKYLLRTILAMKRTTAFVHSFKTLVSPQAVTHTSHPTHHTPASWYLKTRRIPLLLALLIPTAFQTTTFSLLDYWPPSWSSYF